MKARTFVAVLLGVALVAGCKADPNSVDDQIKQVLKARRGKERLAAIENLRRIHKNDPAAFKTKAADVAALLKELGEVKTHVAVLLGEIKEPSTVPALVEAIDFGVGAGADRATKEANDANKEIAKALAEIGDKAAVQPLVKLLRSKDNYVRIEAVNGLARLKDPAAVEALSAMATDETIETFINKKAIMALGDIGDPRAVPAVNQMLFRERKGVSFYPESSFALFEIGEAAKDGVLKVLKSEDKDLMRWAKERRIVEGAIFAKAAQLAADLQDARAVPRLIQLLDYVDPEEKEQLGGQGAVSVMVHVQAADALGRLRAKEGVKPICDLIDKVAGSDIDDPNVRNAYARSLVMIGDRGAIPTLVKCSAKGWWDARESCMAALSRLGGEAEAKHFDQWTKDEPTVFQKECKEAEWDEAKCSATTKAHLESIALHRKRIEVMKGCAEAACLIGKLKESDPAVRERAGWELGRMGPVQALPELIEAIKRPVENNMSREAVEAFLQARFAAINAVDWIAAKSPEARAKARTFADALDDLVGKETGKTDTVKIAEDIKRLVIRLRRRS